MFYPIFDFLEKQDIWLISDTHFNDKELTNAFHRPSDEEILSQINSKLSKNTWLIHLGDVGDIEWAKKIKGHKILVCGNHDKGATKYSDIFDYVFDGPIMLNDKLILSHEPVYMMWAFNIHGHDHNNKSQDYMHYNVCGDIHGWQPLHLNTFIKSGGLKDIKSIHRITIDMAVKRKINNIDTPNSM